ncbi:MAG: hypothetical protein GYB64_08460 [Chloroflexi bacterium]|nr:hypothetical protein [Chloroflexota bacterium]
MSWFFNVDENRGNSGNPDAFNSCGEPGSYATQVNTETVYRLYYFAQQPDGTLEEVDLAYYIGKPDLGDPDSEAALTDLEWVSPNIDNDGDGVPDGDGVLRPAIDHFLSTDEPDEDELGPTDPFLGWEVDGPVMCNTFNIEGTETDFCTLGDWDGDGTFNSEPLAEVEDCDAMRTATIVDYLPSFPYAAVADEPFGNADNECEGNGDFTIDLTSEVPNIFTDAAGNRFLYIEVIGVSGFSENGYEFWAGPPPDDENVITHLPSDANARNMHVFNLMNIAVERSDSTYDPRRIFDDAVVFALGRLPQNGNVGARVDIPLTYISNQFEGQDLAIDLFDPDAGAQGPIYFYFEDVPQSDWVICYGDNDDQCNDLVGVTRSGPDDIPIPGNGTWTGYEFAIPGLSDGIAFYGSTLTANYRTGQNDSFAWRITLDSRPYLTR